jgi:hypothetical protein
MRTSDGRTFSKFARKPSRPTSKPHASKVTPIERSAATASVF